MNTALRSLASKSRMPLLLALALAVGLITTTSSAFAATGDQPDVLTSPAPPLAEEAAVKLSIDGRVADRNSIRGDGVAVRGRASGLRTGRGLARLQVRRVGKNAWRQVATARIRNGEKFSVRWRGGDPGRYLTRLVVRNGGRAASDRLGAVFVYRATFASWYGPGFIGRRTACGQRLTGSILGVAHKTLPCGTRVTFHLRGRTVTARVVDRGPFAHGRDWDLTPALKRRLHFGSTGTVHTTS